VALIVETGTGLSNANGYVSVEFFKTYHGDRGRAFVDPTTSLDYTDDQIGSAIILATDFIDAKFQFTGVRTLDSQCLEWPRVSAYYRDGRIALGVPKEVAECAAELALKQLTGTELAPDPQYDDSLRQTVARREKVGPIEEDVRFTEGGAPIRFKAYPFAERRMKELILNGRYLERI
jgi:hypothetical protein